MFSSQHQRFPASLSFLGHPPVFHKCASKGLSVCVSGLESTLTGISISVDSKWVRGAMIPHRSEDCLGDSERIRCPSQAGECAVPRPIGELGRGQDAAMGPVVRLRPGLVGKPDPVAVRIRRRAGSDIRSYD